MFGTWLKHILGLFLSRDKCSLRGCSPSEERRLGGGIDDDFKLTFCLINNADNKPVLLLKILPVIKVNMDIIEGWQDKKNGCSLIIYPKAPPTLGGIFPPDHRIMSITVSHMLYIKYYVWLLLERFFHDNRGKYLIMNIQ